MGRLVVLIVLVAVAWFAWDRGWRIGEEHVHEYYDRQVELFGAYDHEELCKLLADDFSMDVTTYANGQLVDDDVYDADETCAMTRKMVDGMRILNSRSRGLLDFDINVDIHSIEIARGGRSASVDATTTVRMGDRLVSRSRSRGTERLSRSGWRVRSHGGEGRSWTC